MAARTYFDTSADDLDVLQSATLVGMLKGNSYYNPVLNPERAVQRRNIVLAQMVKRGQLDAAKFESLKQRPLRVEFERQSEPPGTGPALRAAAAQVADRLGRPQRLQHLQRRPRRPPTLDYKLQFRPTRPSRARATSCKSSPTRRGAKFRGRPATRWSNRLHARHARRTRPRSMAARRPSWQSSSSPPTPPSCASCAARKRRSRPASSPSTRRTGRSRPGSAAATSSDDAFDHVQQARRQPGSTFKPSSMAKPSARA